MIRFLKLNDPFRLVVIFFFLLLVRLPFWLGEIPLLSPELTWMLIGEKMNEGFLLYRDFDIVIAPLTAFTYQFIDWCFGRSPLAYQLIAFFLIYVQGVIFNLQINRLMILFEKTYLPAFIYGLCGSFFFDFYTLSPVLMSLTFVLLAFGQLCFAIKEGSTDEISFYIGFYLAIATLFFMPIILMLFVFLIGSLFYTNMNFKGYFVLTFGFLFPYLALFSFYYWHEGLAELFTNLFYYSLIQSDNFIGMKELLLILSIPSIFLGIAILRIFNASGFINYQVRIQTTLLFLLTANVFIIFLVPQLAMYHFLIFVMPMTLFISAFFLIMTKKMIREIAFYTFLISMIYLGYSHKNILKNYLEQSDYILGESTIDSYGKVLVVGQGKENYRNNKVATIYIDWNLSQQYFSDLDNYENLSKIYSNLKKDIPPIIVDNQGIVSKIFYRIPEFQELYEQKGNLYILKK